MIDEEHSKKLVEEREFFDRFDRDGGLQDLILTDAPIAGMWSACRVTGKTVEETLILCLLMRTQQFAAMCDDRVAKIMRQPLLLVQEIKANKAELAFREGLKDVRT